MKKSTTRWKGTPEVLRFPEKKREGLGFVISPCDIGGSIGAEKAGLTPLLGIDSHLPSLHTLASLYPRMGLIAGRVRQLENHVAFSLLGREPEAVIIKVPFEGFGGFDGKTIKATVNHYHPLFDALRIIWALSPLFFVLEDSCFPTHSPRKIRKKTMRASEDITRALFHLGYSSTCFSLDSLDFGVPVGTWRLFLVGWKKKGDEKTVEAILDFVLRSSKRPIMTTVWEAIGDLPLLKTREEETCYRCSPFSAYQESMRSGCANKVTNHRRLKEKRGRERPQPHLHPFSVHPLRPLPLPISPDGKRGFLQLPHPTQNRRLTVREMCRLQGIPDYCEISMPKPEEDGEEAVFQVARATPPVLFETVIKAVMQAL